MDLEHRQPPYRVTTPMVEILRDFWGLTLAPGFPLRILGRNGGALSAEDRECAAEQLAKDGWFLEQDPRRLGMSILANPDGMLIVGQISSSPTRITFGVGLGLAVFVEVVANGLYVGPVQSLREVAKALSNRVLALPGNSDQALRLVWRPALGEAKVVDFVGLADGVAVQDRGLDGPVLRVPVETACRIAEEFAGA